MQINIGGDQININNKGNYVPIDGEVDAKESSESKAKPIYRHYGTGAQKTYDNLTDNIKIGGGGNGGITVDGKPLT